MQLFPCWPTVHLAFTAKLFRAWSVVLLSNPRVCLRSSKYRGYREARIEVIEIRPCSTKMMAAQLPEAQRWLQVIDVCLLVAGLSNLTDWRCKHREHVKRLWAIESMETEYWTLVLNKHWVVVSALMKVVQMELLIIITVKYLLCTWDVVEPVTSCYKWWIVFCLFSGQIDAPHVALVWLNIEKLRFQRFFFIINVFPLISVFTLSSKKYPAWIFLVTSFPWL